MCNRDENRNTRGGEATGSTSLLPFPVVALGNLGSQAYSLKITGPDTVHVPFIYLGHGTI